MFGLVLSVWLFLSPGGDSVGVLWEAGGEIVRYDTESGAIVEKHPPRKWVTAPARTAQAGDVAISATLLPRQSSLAEHIAAEVCFDEADCLLLPNGSTSVMGVAASPDGRWAFVTHILARFTVHTTQLEQGWINTNAVSIIDVRARRLHATFLLDDVDNGAANPWAVAVSPDAKTLYITTAGTHELHVIDFPALLDRIAKYDGNPADQLSFLLDIRERIALPGKGPRALAADAEGVWVAEYFTRSIVRYSADGVRQLSSRSPIVGQGEMLFHDAGLCFQRWQSCSSCHPGGRVDGLNWDLMNDGIGNPKNTKSLVNSHRMPPVMWTGVRPNAEYAVRSGMRHIQFIEPSEEDAKAIDEYLKSLEPMPGLVEDSASVARGEQLFFSAEVGCVGCHPKPLYTDNALHDVGTLGKFDFTVDSEGKRVPQKEFRTPSLLEVWNTAPYLHDGRYRTVREVITEGNQADHRGRTSHLTDQQIDDLAAFVRSL
jgi:DNA-binding beta-propeller fold protein YncE